MIDEGSNAPPAGGARKIFVLGTGRSGTTWMGRIPDSHPEIDITLEKAEIFSIVTTMAVNPASRPKLFPRLVSFYQMEHAAVYPTLYEDKSHPNIWIADRLAIIYPRPVFPGVRHGVYATVASMLRHQGVMYWIHHWEKLPVPGPFLGVTEENIDEHRRLSLAGKCAMRWMSHMWQLAVLNSTLGGRYLQVSYETLQADTGNSLQRIAGFTGLESDFPLPEVRHDSLDRWKTGLDLQDIDDIDCVPARYSGGSNRQQATGNRQQATGNRECTDDTGNDIDCLG